MEPTDAGSSLQGRIRGMLHGVAFGDAMGATIEKLSAAEIRQRYGRVTSLDVDWHRKDAPEAARGGRINSGSSKGGSMVSSVMVRGTSVVRCRTRRR